MKNINISKETLLLFLMIFFSLKIGCISYVSKFINIPWHIISIFISIYTFLSLKKSNKINILDLMILLFYITILISTIINKVSLTNYIKEIILFSSLYFVLKYGLNKNPKKFIKIYSNYLLFLIVINTIISIIIYPNSMFRDNNNPILFLGGDNTSIRLYITSVIFCFINNYVNKGKIEIPVLSLTTLLIFSVIRDIGGGKICFILLFLCILYLKYFPITYKKPMKLIIIINIVLFLIMVISNKLEIFKFIIVNILHRSLSLTDRTIIWNITIDKIIASPLIGYGMINGLSFQAMLPYITGINAHNTYLMILFEGGIFSFGIFLLILQITAKKFDKINHEKWIYIIPIGMLTLMIRAQIEGWDVIWIFMFCQLIYSYNIIENLVKSQKSPIKYNEIEYKNYGKRSKDNFVIKRGKV